MKHHFRKFCRSHSDTAQFLRFAAVGVKISLIDAGGVYLLPWLFGMHLYPARAISLSAALLVGYLLNRYFTFKAVRRGGFFRQMAGHFSVHLLGGLLNFAVFAAAIEVGHNLIDHPLERTLLPLGALWAGGIVGLVFNFFFSRKFVFRKGAPRPDGPIPPEPGFYPQQSPELNREG